VGLFDFFSNENKEARAVGRWQNKLMGKYLQTTERKRAIHALTEIGTSESILALLKRYQYRTEASIVDEDEKELVFTRCVSLGRRAVPGLIQYINAETGIYWPVKALRQIVGDEEVTTQLLAALDNVEDVFGTNRQRREELVDQLRNFAEDDRVYDVLLGLLQDEDEEIVIRAVDGLSVREDDPDVAAAVVPLLVSEDSSHRVRTLIMELMLSQEWNVKRHKKRLKDVIPESYWIDDTGVVRRK
jgi:hypothetical protein